MTITPILWYRPTKDGTHQIKIRFYENGNSTYEALGLTIEKKYWDSSRKQVKRNHPDATEYNVIINQKLIELHSSPKNKSVITKPENQNLSIEDVVALMIRELESKGQIGLSKKYRVVLSHLTQSSLNRVSVNDFGDNERIRFNEHLTNVACVSTNTSSGYNKTLRRFINYAIEKGYRTTQSPYKGERIKEEAPRPKHSLNWEQLNDLKEMLIGARHIINGESTALSAFIFSVHSYGMRFGDVVTLKWKNFRPGLFQYTMRKSSMNNVTINLLDEHYEILRLFLPDEYNCSLFSNGAYQEITDRASLSDLKLKLLEVEKEYYSIRAEVYSRIENVAPGCTDREKIKSLNVVTKAELEHFNEIVNLRAEKIKLLVEQFILKGAPKNESYVFPLLKNESLNPKQLHSQISSKNALVNKALKDISKSLGFPHISFHSARHSFAVNQYMASKDIYALSRALKHKSLDVTIVYLQSLNIDVAAKSNEDFSTISRVQYPF